GRRATGRAPRASRSGGPVVGARGAAGRRPGGRLVGGRRRPPARRDGRRPGQGVGLVVRPLVTPAGGRGPARRTRASARDPGRPGLRPPTRDGMTTGPWSFRFSQANSPGKTEIAWGRRDGRTNV